MRHIFKLVYTYILLRALLPAAVFLPSLLTAATEIDTIRFIHNTPFDKDDLLDVVHSQEGDNYEPRLVKLDQILLTNFFRKNGYLTVDISDSIAYSKDRQRLILFFKINAGQRYYYGGVHFEGVKEIPLEKLQKQFSGLKINAPFDETQVNLARDGVVNVYYNSGKPFVHIGLDYRFEQDSLVFALLQIRENQTVYIKDIHYYGLQLVQQFLVRRELEIKKGDKYNREALEYSQQNLYAMGLFRYVHFEIEPIKEDTTQVYLDITFQEKDPRWIGFTIGVAQEESDYNSSQMEITLQGGHRNLYGTARSISLQITPSFQYSFDRNKIVNTKNLAALKFVEPWIGNTRTPGIFQLSFEQHRPLNSGNFDLFRSSFEVQHKYPRKHIDISATISAKNLDTKSTRSDTIDVSKITDFSAGQSQIYSITGYAKRDTRPNLFNPNNGALTDLSISFSETKGKLAAQNNSFITVISSWSRYQPWRPTLYRKKLHWTLASRLKLGAIFDVGKTQSVPISELFFAGGAATVRGYQEQFLGPAATIDSTTGYITQAAGGRLLFLANIEVRIPLFWLFVGEYFIDSGNVWSNVTNFNPTDIRFTTGVGLAIITPLGPVRVDYGYKLNRQRIDPTPDAFHLGIYFAF